MSIKIEISDYLNPNDWCYAHFAKYMSSMSSVYKKDQPTNSPFNGNIPTKWWNGVNCHKSLYTPVQK